CKKKSECEREKNQKREVKGQEKGEPERKSEEVKRAVAEKERKGEPHVRKQERKHENLSEGRANESLFVRGSEVKSAMFARKQLLVLLYKDVYFSTNELNKSLPSVVVSLLQEFADLFPEEIPHGLPPLRGIEHQIDFIPGASIPNRPAYRTNLEETKEIQ